MLRFPFNGSTRSMQILGKQLVFSASDLAHFSECEHRIWLDRLHLDAPMEKTADDEQARLFQQRGFEHEASFLAQLKEQHASCVEIEASGLDAQVAQTRAAIEDGVEVIFQATLRRGNLIGHADFLILVPSPDAPSQHSYEVVDTKLAHSTKAKFILQLCFYSDLLSDLTGALPKHMHVELGNGKRETHRVADYIHYTCHLLDRFVADVAAYPNKTPPYPVPCDHCSLCHWRERCEAQRLADDHLSAVANITHTQTVKLEAAGVTTVAALARLDHKTAIAKLEAATLARLREQAALQVHERETGEQKFVILPLIEDEVCGFARLPRPDAGDLFFDMEGDPLYEGGLEYLFGVYCFDAGQPVFRCFWAHDRVEERRALVEFLDFVVARLALYPGMHIYHYAPYENTALKRLMTAHGVGEAVVDQLLREHRLVDLYKVVREALRISKPSYSIKAVEAFYAGKRDADVKTAGDSIVVYERWRQLWEPSLLESIRTYNEDDCRSTWQLREWLVTMRPEAVGWFDEAAAHISGKSKRDKSDKTQELEARLESMHRRLVVAPENKSIASELAELLYFVLDFHRREDKSSWWALFDRQDAELEDLLDDSEVIAGLHAPEWVDGGDRYDVTRYRYPEQDFKLKAGSRAKRLSDLREVKVVEIDEDARTVDLEFSLKEEAPATMDISSGAPINVDVIRAAVFDFVESVIADTGRHKALLGYLRRTLPDIEGIAPGESITGTGGTSLPAIISAVRGMRETCLFIQGPPGTGKTYTGAHLIAALLQDGKRIAVSSNSHKAIVNLLQAVDRTMLAAGASYVGMNKVSQADHGIDSPFILNVGDAKTIIEAMPQLVAGTAWLLSRPSFRVAFDYLFVDEAGQVSLANLIGMGSCASNIVLLGDQMQLSQPIKGAHPGRSGESALDYLLDGEATIAPDRGVFLDRTFRMHPDVCRFISDAIYDSRLHSDPSTFDQALVLNDKAHPALKPTGICYLPVEHEGCSQRNEVEAELIRELVENLLTQRYRTGRGEVRPMTLDDILVVAPYNMQVNLLKRVLPKGARVGTVDKFQGQEAQIVILSMTTSDLRSASRGISFLLSKNRLNVAISRAKCLTFVVGNPAIANLQLGDPAIMRLVSTYIQVQRASPSHSLTEAI